MWTLPSDQNATLHSRIVGLIETLIKTGRLQPGERLPAERLLAERLGVNRSTVVRALDDLADRGLILGRMGSGRLVNPHKWGVQSYRLVNWPSDVVPQAGKDAFSLKAERVLREGWKLGKPIQDLSGDALPADLLPRLQAPQRAWSEMIRAEQEEEGAHLGLASFRERTRLFLRHSLRLEASPDEVLITTGTRQTLFLLTQCLLRPGDAVGVESPSYFYSLPLFQAAGLRIYALPVDGQGVTVEGLEALQRLHPLKMLFLNPIFQNPTGSLMRTARKEALLEYCLLCRLPIVEDDAYSLTGFTDHPDMAPLKTHDRHSQVLYAGSLSSYAGRSLRVGWLLAPGHVVARLAGVRRQMDAGPSVLPQLLAEHYMRQEFEEHRQALRQTLVRRCEALLERLHELGDAVHYIRPQGGFYVYVRVKNSGPDAREAVERRLLQCGLIPAPGTRFGDQEGSYRFNFACYAQT